ncbi:MAG: type II toxin-antitoxin system VapC family toxin [Chloroflexales bacterium]|nr:type II toxin-antitoxin system VapC family toxin [Chloroflexales bacterium]
MAIPIDQRAVTIISADEQLQGRLAMIRRAKTQLNAAREYEWLRETLQFFSSVRLLAYDAAVVAQIEALRRQSLRIGTQDLRIASICLTQQATLATRNLRDFGLVPGLMTEDWSLPSA